MVVGSPIPVGHFPFDVAITPDGTHAYVANQNDDTVSVIDTATNMVVGSPIPVGHFPYGIAIAHVPFSAFSAFTVKLDLTVGPSASKDVFDLTGTFTLGASSNGIAPLTEPVSLVLAGGTGAVTITIPAGSFTKTRKGSFVFQGTLNGVALQAQITPVGSNQFTFRAEGTGADLTGFANPVTVTLTIGDDRGTTTVTAQFQ